MTKPRTRIQERNSKSILDAALDVFSKHGYRGATLDQIADVSGLSKPNLLYYYASKEAVYKALLDQLLIAWIDPLRALNPNGEPVPEILAYVRRKLELSRHFPRESRLFANEILQGAPRISDVIGGELKIQVDEKAAVISTWISQGRLNPVPPVHLIFSIWSLTQHYADFDAQVRIILGEGHDPFAEAEDYLTTLFTKLLTPTP